MSVTPPSQSFQYLQGWPLAQSSNILSNTCRKGRQYSISILRGRQNNLSGEPYRLVDGGITPPAGALQAARTPARGSDTSHAHIAQPPVALPPLAPLAPAGASSGLSHVSPALGSPPPRWYPHPYPRRPHRYKPMTRIYQSSSRGWILEHVPTGGGCVPCAVCCVLYHCVLYRYGCVFRVRGLFQLL